jgi:hypothetical protein
MAQYLIVTHKTAFATELRDKVGELAAADPTAEFAILVREARSARGDRIVISYECVSV